MRSPTDHAFLPLSHLIIIYTFTTLQASAACFWPNGTEDSTTRFLPCKSSGPSMCCLLNTNLVGAADLDTCDPNGLCIPSDNNGVWRGLCTDKDWNDPACLNLCTTGLDNDNSSQNAAAHVLPLTTCGDGSLCCGSKYTLPGADCCSKRKGLFIENGKLVSTFASASSTSAAPSSASTSITGIFSSSSASSAPASDSSNNTAAIVGGVVGGIAGIVIAAMAFWYFIIRRNLKKGRQQREGVGFEYQTEDKARWQNASEAPTNEARIMGEMDSAQQPGTQELPTYRS